MARTLPAFTRRQERVGNVVIKIMSSANTWLYRISRGRLGGRFLYGAPVLLLVTRGRRSGTPRTAPLLYLEDGDRFVVVASKGGMSHHPKWYLNLEADPNVEVELGAERRSMRARRATPEEKSALWPRLVKMYPPYDSYQARTDREIPVVLLEPRS